ncbi:MAG: GyrI-like domain-containing protein [Planctomycetota bacterium]|jgi:effector-binding domain-containing protein|nr:hypothetical protein [Planctomycetota bacterium]MDP6518338.1 GyrI-like domain-containing protein [Planctomycetota bacterium]MDP6838309.1 GyrI-like domain-containing protein [Planctomycetota bacterium]MDP6955010.1 GyrI-like domain-containing protein [Planctomycetota bacterium]
MSKTSALLLCLLAACASPDKAPPLEVRGPTFVPVRDLPVAHAPFESLESSWKQRLAQPYVYLEHTGSYHETGALLPVLHREALAQGLAPSGPPFGLYYDNPAVVPVEQLRSRACLPVAAPQQPRPPLAYALLPSTTVIYAYVGGPYPEVARAYPPLMAHLARMGWVLNGPARETYLIAPDTVEDFSELITEIQLPGGPAGG